MALDEEVMSELKVDSGEKVEDEEMKLNNEFKFSFFLVSTIFLSFSVRPLVVLKFPKTR